MKPIKNQLSKLQHTKPTHLQAILNSKAGYSKSYLKHLRITMEQSFGMARANTIININVTEFLILPTFARDNTRRSITDHERTVYLKVAETHRAGIWSKAVLYCGLRPQEVVALNWGDIDFRNKVIKVSQACKADGKIGYTKSEAGSRLVPIPDEYLQLLMLHKPMKRLELERAGALSTTALRAVV